MAARLAAAPTHADLHGILLDLNLLIGQLQGAVRDAARERDVTQADAALQQLKATARTVAHDIRLASPEALHMGMAQALGEAGEVIALLASESP